MATVTKSKKPVRKPRTIRKTKKMGVHPVSGLPVLKPRAGRKPVTVEMVNAILNS